MVVGIELVEVVFRQAEGGGLAVEDEEFIDEGDNLVEMAAENVEDGFVMLRSPIELEAEAEFDRWLSIRSNVGLGVIIFVLV